MGIHETTGCMNIFFDLDGTLLDSRERLYQLFQHLVPDSKLSFKEYWEFKRNKTGHREILETYFSYSEEAFYSFERMWMENIELPEWLALDKPFEGVTNYLRELKTKHSLYLVTARQFEDIATQQINQSGWKGIFKKILVTRNKMDKYNLVKAAVKISGEDWFVGDTGKDIQTGKRLGINTAAVLSGFLNKNKLEEYNPDLIVDSIKELNFKTLNDII